MVLLLSFGSKKFKTNTLGLGLPPMVSVGSPALWLVWAIWVVWVVWWVVWVVWVRGCVVVWLCGWLCGCVVSCVVVWLVVAWLVVWLRGWLCDCVVVCAPHVRRRYAPSNLFAVYVCVYVCVYACVYLGACVRACVYARTRKRMCKPYVCLTKNVCRLLPPAGPSPAL